MEILKLEGSALGEGGKLVSRPPAFLGTVLGGKGETLVPLEAGAGQGATALFPGGFVGEMPEERGPFTPLGCRFARTLGSCARLVQ